MLAKTRACKIVLLPFTHAGNTEGALGQQVHSEDILQHSSLYEKRVKMFWFLSWTTLKQAKCSRPLQRLLCETRTHLPVLTLFTKKPCPLCDEAKVILEPYKHKFILQEIDISLPHNSAWFEKYKYDIPVFHLNGRFLMKHQVDVEKLEDQLLKLDMQDDGSR